MLLSAAWQPDTPHESFLNNKDLAGQYSREYSEDECEFQKHFVQQTVWETRGVGQTGRLFGKEYPYSTK
jgi:hypothetical protein